MRAPKFLINWLEENRGLVIVIFCLPASFIFDLLISVVKWVKRNLVSGYATHFERVKTVQRAVKKWNLLPENERKFMCTARPNWLSLSTTFVQKKEMHNIPVDLYEILDLDTKKMVITVEPLVTVREVTKFLVPKGYALACTLEIGDATLGGLAMAVGMTTYSHKVGLFQETVVAYEIVLPDGSHAHVTKTNEYKDLFKCLPWSHGTLGFLVGLELEIVPSKPYVHLEYIPVHGQEAYCNKMRELSGALDKKAKVPDFLEATIYSKESAVISVGHFADFKSKTEEEKININHVTRWYKPWFYKHVETFLHKRGDEYIPLEEYLLRHNRAIFWVLESMIPFGNDPLFRFLLGWLCPPKPAFLKFTTTPGIRALTFTKQVFQDIVLPMTALESSIDTATELFDTFPLLIYPSRIYDHGRFSGQLRPPRPDQMTPGTDYGMFYDLGVYGSPGAVKKHQKYDAVHAMRTMEKFIRDCGGYSFLYADIFMTENEFEQMFDLTLYNEVRQKYGAGKAFPGLFDKVKPEVDVFELGKQSSEN